VSVTLKIIVDMPFMCYAHFDQGRMFTRCISMYAAKSLELRRICNVIPGSSLQEGSLLQGLLYGPFNRTNVWCAVQFAEATDFGN
jgi:hypothetical protein